MEKLYYDRTNKKFYVKELNTEKNGDILVVTGEQYVDVTDEIVELMALTEKFEEGYKAGVYDAKNKILRWAMEHKKAIEVNGDESAPYTRGEYGVFLALIDKIHSL